MLYFLHHLSAHLKSCRPCKGLPRFFCAPHPHPSPQSAPAVKARSCCNPHKGPCTAPPLGLGAPHEKSRSAPVPSASLSMVAVLHPCHHAWSSLTEWAYLPCKPSTSCLTDLRAQATRRSLAPHVHQAAHTCFCAGARTHHAGLASGSSGVRLWSPHLSAADHGYGTVNSDGNGTESETRTGSGSVRGDLSDSSPHRGGSGSWSESWSGSWRSLRQKKRRRRSGGCRWGRVQVSTGLGPSAPCPWSPHGGRA